MVRCVEEICGQDMDVLMGQFLVMVGWRLKVDVVLSGRCRKVTSKYLEFLAPKGKGRQVVEESERRSAGFEEGRGTSEEGSSGSWDSTCQEVSTEEEGLRVMNKELNLQKSWVGSGRKQKMKKLSSWSGNDGQGDSGPSRDQQNLKRRSRSVVVRVRKRSKRNGKADHLPSVEDIPLSDEDVSCKSNKASVVEQSSRQNCGSLSCMKTSTRLQVDSERPSESEADILLQGSTLEKRVSSASFPSAREDDVAGVTYDDPIKKSTNPSSKHSQCGHVERSFDMPWKQSVGGKKPSGVDSTTNTIPSKNNANNQGTARTAEELQPIMSWLHEFVKHVEEASEDLEGYRMEPVSQLLRQHPELQGLVKKKAPTDSPVHVVQNLTGSEKQTDLFISNLKVLHSGSNPTYSLVGRKSEF